MKISICTDKPWNPHLLIDIFGKHIVFMPWVKGRWLKWQIKKGFYVKVYRFHPIEIVVYY